ncbi:MAG: 3-oxoacyl-ACP reductase FabG [Firmicutes bacterium]|nr:3-oxoacyl-ACP reductase FabG [Bacillota bacterium]
MRDKKTVIITGAARGIGKATAEVFCARGWNVLLNYHTSEAEALRLRDELQGPGGSVAVFQADVTDRARIDQMVDHCLGAFGGLDVLVNNAGLSRYSLFGGITEDEWDQVMGVNLKGVFNCCQSVLPLMLKQKSGKIINVSSIWGMVGASCEVHYSAAKAGVIGLTKALAKELGPSNIQVNCVAPGVVATDMINTLTLEELADLEQATPLLRIGAAREIASCIYYLASSEADFITGQVISPNGGFVI